MPLTDFRPSSRVSRILLLGVLFVFVGLLVPVPLCAQGVVEFSVPGVTLLWGITAGPDGALWFTDYGGRVGRITTGGVSTVFTVSGSMPQGITAGPDGALWFADGASKIGRITTSGAITKFPISGGAADITSGPDGALWFTDQGSSKVGRITTSGAVTEYSTLTANSSPMDITVGPDGNLWFTESGADKVGRITTGGAIAEFPVTAGAGLQGITAGPDGNLWFTESNAGKIGRMTTAGDLTEFPLPSTTRSFDIVAGPDGNLWFTEFDANRIGRITTSGEVTEFFITTANSSPYGITVGPDGNLWFTEFATAKIGMVTPPPSPAGMRLYTLTPCRLVDTRDPLGPLGGPALLADTGRYFALAGTCGVPATAQVVAINVTVTQPTASGHLTLYPAGVDLPLSSTINYRAGQTRANNAFLPLGPDGSILVFCGQTSGTVHLIVDVSGYLH